MPRLSRFGLPGSDRRIEKLGSHRFCMRVDFAAIFQNASWKLLGLLVRASAYNAPYLMLADKPLAHHVRPFVRRDTFIEMR